MCITKAQEIWQKHDGMHGTKQVAGAFRAVPGPLSAHDMVDIHAKNILAYFEEACRNTLQDNELYSVPKGNVHERADGVSQVSSDTFCSIAKEPGKRNDGYGIHCKDNGLIYTSKIDGDAHGDKDQQHIEPTREKYDFTAIVESYEYIRPGLLLF